MNYCDHCEGQRFDRAQVLRALRHLRSEMRRKHRGSSVDQALGLAIKRVLALDIPHLDLEEEGGEVVH